MNEEIYKFIEKEMSIRRYGRKRGVILPALINELKLGVGVEVGVDLGDNAKEILDKTSIYLYLVDNYEWRKKKVGKSRYDMAKEKLSIHLENKRCEFLYGESSFMANRIEDNALDFCYIDADHSYEGIKKDVTSWWPKVKVGGIFSGHDYKKKNDIKTTVMRYMDEFVIENGLRLFALGGRGGGFLIVK